MSTLLAQKLEQAGEGLVEALEQLTEQLGDMKVAYRDHQTQLMVQSQSVQQVRTEVLGRIDALEVKVLSQFETVQAQLHSIAMKLSMNGSGHG